MKPTSLEDALYITSSLLRHNSLVALCVRNWSQSSYRGEQRFYLQKRRMRWRCVARIWKENPWFRLYVHCSITIELGHDYASGDSERRDEHGTECLEVGNPIRCLTVMFAIVHKWQEEAGYPQAHGLGIIGTGPESLQTSARSYVDLRSLPMLVLWCALIIFPNSRSRRVGVC